MREAQLHLYVDFVNLVFAAQGKTFTGWIKGSKCPREAKYHISVPIAHGVYVDPDSPFIMVNPELF